MRTVLFAFFLFLASAAWAQNGDPVEGFSTQDLQMNAAMAEARRTLDQFLSDGLSANGQGLPGTSLKVAFDLADGGSEVIWVGPFVWDGNVQFAGLLANQPNFMGGLNAGDRVDFDISMVRDWAVAASDGLLYGHYTTRVIASRLDGDQRANLEAILSPSPIPAGW